MAPQHSGFIHEYPLIRVDNFTAHLPRLPSTLPRASYQDLPEGATHFVHPHVLLLSHCHTDHLAGLLSVAKHGAPIYCSDVTKRLLLALERKEDRARFDNGMEPRRIQPYAKLQRSQRQCAALAKHAGGAGTSKSAHGLDLLVALPFDEPVDIAYSAGVRLRLTLFSANHMPGSTMFLIQGSRGSVLHTGDVRTDTGFVEKLLTQTHLSTISVQLSPVIDTLERDGRFRTPESSSDRSLISLHDTASPPSPQHEEAESAALHHLYIDTERLLDSNEPPTKMSAILDTLQLLRLLGKTQRIHINCWTSGYESFLLAIEKAFGAEMGKIHVDRYKCELYAIMSRDPEYRRLTDIISTDRSECGRFCACDDAQCMQTAVQVKPEEGMSMLTWQETKQRLRHQIRAAAKGKGEYPSSLPLPLQRHSPLRELYRTIALLRPRHITANTAGASARYILARVSERLRLTSLGDEDVWQKSCSLVRKESEERQWSILESAWREASITGQPEPGHGNVVTDAAFFERVGRFRRLLYGLKNDLPQRLRREMLDAEAEMLDDDAVRSPAYPDVNFDVDASNEVEVESRAKSKQPWTVPGKYASLHSSPFRTQAMLIAQPASISHVQEPAANRVESGEQHEEPPAGQAELTVELASRYIAYTAMYLGWRIRNPSRYSQDVAWRAIRKLRPDLARSTEEALFKELGWPIPPWSSMENDASINASTLCPTTSLTLDTIAEQPRDAEPQDTACELLPSNPNEAPSHRSELERKVTSEAETQSEQFSSQVGETLKNKRPEVNAGSIAAVSKAMWQAMQQETASQHEVSQCMAHVPLLLEAEQCLRTSRPLADAATRGLILFASIVEHLAQFAGENLAGVSHRDVNPPELSALLTLIGAAARSRRARQFLGWETVDFSIVRRVLASICSQSVLAPMNDTKANQAKPTRPVLAASGHINTNASPLPMDSTTRPIIPLGWPGRTLPVLRYLEEATGLMASSPTSATGLVGAEQCRPDRSTKRRCHDLA